MPFFFKITSFSRSTSKIISNKVTKSTFKNFNNFSVINLEGLLYKLLKFQKRGHASTKPHALPFKGYFSLV